MRATEIIRNILDVIDGIDNPRESVVTTVAISSESDSQQDLDMNHSNDAWEMNRYKQIVDLLSDETDYNSPFSNTPNPKISDVDAVIMSGDDVNKSKHPSDLRANSISLYPNFQAKE